MKSPEGRRKPRQTFGFFWVKLLINYENHFSNLHRCVLWDSIFKKVERNINEEKQTMKRQKGRESRRVLKREYTYEMPLLANNPTVQSSMPPALSKKPEETRLRLFVSFLFLCCAGTVLASHIFYRQHIGEVSHLGCSISSGSIIFSWYWSGLCS